MHVLFTFANLLSLLRMLLTPLCVGFLLSGSAYYLSAFIIFFFAAITDYFDGYAARRLNDGAGDCNARSRRYHYAYGNAATWYVSCYLQLGEIKDMCTIRDTYVDVFDSFRSTLLLFLFNYFRLLTVFAVCE